MFHRNAFMSLYFIMVCCWTAIWGRGTRGLWLTVLYDPLIKISWYPRWHNLFHPGDNTCLFQAPLTWLILSPSFIFLIAIRSSVSGGSWAWRASLTKVSFNIMLCAHSMRSTLVHQWLTFHSSKLTKIPLCRELEIQQDLEVCLPSPVCCEHLLCSINKNLMCSSNSYAVVFRTSLHSKLLKN